MGSPQDMFLTQAPLESSCWALPLTVYQLTAPEFQRGAAGMDVGYLFSQGFHQTHFMTIVLQSIYFSIEGFLPITRHRHGCSSMRSSLLLHSPFHPVSLYFFKCGFSVARWSISRFKTFRLYMVLIPLCSTCIAQMLILP